MPDLSHTTSPIVSIVIPTYNQNPDYLREAVGSALAQTFRDIEVVVSDNHTTNGALRALDMILDPRLRIVRPECHLPIIQHFAFAADQAKGDFISFLASDDLVSPDWLENLLPLFEQYPEAVFGFGEIEKVPHDAPDQTRYHFRNLAMPTGYYSSEQMVPRLIRMDRAAGWMVGDLIRRDAYLAAGGISRDPVAYCADYALSLRLLETGGGMVYLNRTVAKNRAWEEKDGKADARRTQASAADVATIFEMLETSPRLGSIVQYHVTEVRSARAHKARFMTLVLLMAIARDEIETESITTTIADIRKIDAGSLLNKLLFMACRPGFATLLRALHAPALWFARSRLGQALLKL